MKITKTAQAGASQLSDILIQVMPNPEGGIRLELDSKRVILKQFGKQMERVVREKIDEMEIEDLVLKAKDNGALDYTIRARVQAAIERAI